MTAMLMSIDYTPIDATPAAPASAGIMLPSGTTQKKTNQAASAPPVYDYPTRTPASSQGIHRVYGGDIVPEFGHHSVFAEGENAQHFDFVPSNTSLARSELDALVNQWIVPTMNGKPFDAEGIFCGQISCKSPEYAIALMASVLQVKVFCFTPKFKPNPKNGRIMGHVEFWVERGQATKFTAKSKGLVCCEEGGFYVATSLAGSRTMQGHSLHVPPTKVGVPQWPVTLEPRRSTYY